MLNVQATSHQHAEDTQHLSSPQLQRPQQPDRQQQDNNIGSHVHDGGDPERHGGVAAVALERHVPVLLDGLTEVDEGEAGGEAVAGGYEEDEVAGGLEEAGAGEAEVEEEDGGFCCGEGKVVGYCGGDDLDL